MFDGKYAKGYYLNNYIVLQDKVSNYIYGINPMTYKKTILFDFKKYNF